MPNLTTAEPATSQAASISETEAAKRLGVIPATLRTWRLKGLLADGLVTETPSPAPGGRARIRYDANWINSAGSGVDSAGNYDVPSIFAVGPEPA